MTNISNEHYTQFITADSNIKLESDLTNEFIIESLRKNPHWLTYLDNVDTSEYPNYVLFSITQYFELKSKYKISQTLNLPAINWEKLCKNNICCQTVINQIVEFGQLNEIPPCYVDEEQLIKGIKCASQEIEQYVKFALDTETKFDLKKIYKVLFDCDTFSINVIPHEFQSDEMIQKVLTEVASYNSHILKFLRLTPEVEQKMLELCAIKDIPQHLHTNELCLKAINDDPYNLQYINSEFINELMLNTFFRHKLLRDVPRNDRFSMITKFDEKRLIKILQYKPMLLSILSSDQRTYNVLKSLVTFSGYSIQYLTYDEQNYNDCEFVKIALKNEPRAIKYLFVPTS